jgi:hypothetical protein
LKRHKVVEAEARREGKKKERSGGERKISA